MLLARNSSTSQNLHGDATEVTCKGKEQVISLLPPPSFSTRQLRLAASSGGSEKSYLSLLMLLGKMPLLGGQKIKLKYCISWTCYQEDDWFCVGWLWTSLAECDLGPVTVHIHSSGVSIPGILTQLEVTARGPCWCISVPFEGNLVTFLAAQLVENLPAVEETLVQFLGWEDPLEKG